MIESNISYKVRLWILSDSLEKSDCRYISGDVSTLCPWDGHCIQFMESARSYLANILQFFNTFFFPKLSQLWCVAKVEIWPGSVSQCVRGVMHCGQRYQQFLIFISWKYITSKGSHDKTNTNNITSRQKTYFSTTNPFF